MGVAQRILRAPPELAYWRSNTTYRMYAIAAAASAARLIFTQLHGRGLRAVE